MSYFSLRCFYLNLHGSHLHPSNLYWRLFNEDFLEHLFKSANLLLPSSLDYFSPSAIFHSLLYNINLMREGIFVYCVEHLEQCPIPGRHWIFAEWIYGLKELYSPFQFYNFMPNVSNYYFIQILSYLKRFWLYVTRKAILAIMIFFMIQKWD